MSKYKTRILVGLVAVLLLTVGAKVGMKVYRDSFMVQGPGGLLPANTASSTETGTNNTATGLLDTQWVWKYTNNIDGTRTTAPAGEKFITTFGSDKTLTSTTDCNQLGASFIVDQEILSIGNMVATEKACGGMILEQVFAKDLGYASSYVITGNELKINLTKDVGTMYFVKKTKVTASDSKSVNNDTKVSVDTLNNKKYRLASYNGVVIPESQVYTLTFGEVTSGQKNNYAAKFCNGMGGMYSVSNSTIKGTVIGTMMYCESPANLMTMESVFAEIFNTGATATISGDTLTLLGNKGQKFVYSTLK